MIFLITSLVLVHIYLSLRKPLLGLCFLLAIRILVPDNTRLLSLDISLNLACSLLLMLGWFGKLLMNKQSVYNLQNGLIRYLKFFLIFIILILFVTDGVPAQLQLKYLLQYVILQLLPVVIAINVVNTREDLMKVIFILVVSTAVCVTYSLVCFFMSIPYPYNDWVNNYFPSRESNLQLVVNSSMGGVIGRCMGTATSGTYDYGMVICILFTMMGSIYYKIRNKWVCLVYLLCGLDVLCTTRRAPIITAMTFCLILYGRSIIRDRYGLFYLFAASITLFLSVHFFSFLKDFRGIIETALFFWDDSIAEKNDVSGSSVEFRLYQLERTIIYIKNNPLFGNGWGSCFYKGKYSDMIGWESIVFTTLMQFGFMGAFVWSMLFFKFYKYSTKYKDQLLGLAFMVSSMALCILTDTIYPFYIFLGAVLINKMSLLLSK